MNRNALKWIAPVLLLAAVVMIAVLIDDDPDDDIYERLVRGTRER